MVNYIFESLIYFLRYIRDNETLVLKHYDEMKDEPLSDLFRQVSIRTENQLMVFSDYISGKIVQTTKETKDLILYLTKVNQLNFAHMFHDQLLNQVQKVSTMQHAMQ